jgi:hypothetical protein
MEFFKNMFTEDSDHDKICLRRTIGLICAISLIVALFIPSINSDNFDVLAHMSIILLTSTTIDKFVPKSKSECQEE